MLALTGAVLLAGCFGPEPEAPGPAAAEIKAVSSEEGFDILEDLGYARNRVEEQQDGYAIDGDLYLTREDLALERRNMAGALGKKAQRYSAVVTSPAPQSLRLAIHSSASSYNQVIQQAVNSINALKTRLHIEVVPSGSGDITVYSDQSASLPVDMRNIPWHAKARGVAGGQPGPLISINMEHPTMMASLVNRISVLIHEIGHTVGLEHTNETFGTHIAGTATSDPTSIMVNDGSLAQGILTYSDILAFEYLYPSDKPLGGLAMDSDAWDDLVVWRPSDLRWYIKGSSSNFNVMTSREWGTSADIPMENMDIDGDGRDDRTTWNGSDGFWRIYQSSNNTPRIIGWGLPGDVPLANTDIDGDRRDDLVVWRWKEARFYILTSRSNYTSSLQYDWGQAGDIPVPGVDTDKDNKDDLIIWRPGSGQFWVLTSRSGFSSHALYNMGQSGDIPVGSNDLDRDGWDDLVLFRPSNGTWYAATSSSNLLSITSNQWGRRGDVPIIGTDIDKDNRPDIIVWRPPAGSWHVKKSSSNFTTSTTYLWVL